MGFGLSLDLLDFSTTFTRKKLSIYRDLPTLNLLNRLLVYHLTKKFKFQAKTGPEISDIGWYLTEIFINAFQSPLAINNIFKNFFTHMFLFDSDIDEFGIILLLKIDDKIYMTPNDRYPYSQNLFRTFSENRLFLFFDYYKIWKFMPFCWQLENAWVQTLSKYVIQRNETNHLMLIELSHDAVIVQRTLYNFYTLLLTSFHTFPFTSEETESKEIIYKYITTMQQFLNVTK